MFTSIETKYKAAKEAFQQAENRRIALEHSLKTRAEQQESLRLRLASLALEGQTTAAIEQDLAGVNAQLQAVAGKLQSYQKRFEEWERADCLIKQMQYLRLRDAAETLRQQRATLLKGMSADAAEAAIRRREEQLNAGLEASRRAQDEQSLRLSGIRGELRQLAAAIAELQHKKEEIDAPDSLSETINERRIALREAEQKLSLTAATLMRQAQNVAKRAELDVQLAEKEQIWERWEKLNKLIGSADGTKFKVIAQGYTLNLLLLHANQHLSYLSRRYRLQQVGDSLALQVIDRDMADEVRTVYSLSGGESFLISLALALGLSSLSGTNLKVESLFIDEGFGSLDADSLSTVMDALERLQLQGRKIGVISHVQEMSERISVQVQVYKGANGRSRIRIVG
jgi:exonuclease SbcC